MRHNQQNHIQPTHQGESEEKENKPQREEGGRTKSILQAFIKCLPRVCRVLGTGEQKGKKETIPALRKLRFNGGDQAHINNLKQGKHHWPGRKGGGGVTRDQERFP